MVSGGVGWWVALGGWLCLTTCWVETHIWWRTTWSTTWEEVPRKSPARISKLWTHSVIKSKSSIIYPRWSEPESSHSFSSNKEPSASSSQLFHSSFFASFVLKPDLKPTRGSSHVRTTQFFRDPHDIPIRTRVTRVTHLDHPHRKPGFLGELFPYMSGGFRGLVECGLQNFQLFCFYGRSWPSSFGASRAVFIFIALGIIINITINRT